MSWPICDTCVHFMRLGLGAYARGICTVAAQRLHEQGRYDLLSADEHLRSWNTGCTEDEYIDAFAETDEDEDEPEDE